MKIEVKQERGIYFLFIEGEKVLKDKKLSSIVNKIEQYLKLRFLKEEPKGGISRILDNLAK